MSLSTHKVVLLIGVCLIIGSVHAQIKTCNSCAGPCKDPPKPVTCADVAAGSFPPAGAAPEVTAWATLLGNATLFAPDKFTGCFALKFTATGANNSMQLQSCGPEKAGTPPDDLCKVFTAFYEKTGKVDECMYCKTDNCNELGNNKTTNGAVSDLYINTATLSSSLASVVLYSLFH